MEEVLARDYETTDTGSSAAFSQASGTGSDEFDAIMSTVLGTAASSEPGSTSQFAGSAQQLHEYLGEPVAKAADPLQWWKVHINAIHVIFAANNPLGQCRTLSFACQNGEGRACHSGVFGVS